MDENRGVYIPETRTSWGSVQCACQQKYAGEFLIGIGFDVGELSVRGFERTSNTFPLFDMLTFVCSLN